jgi:hypothetical protein
VGFFARWRRMGRSIFQCCNLKMGDYAHFSF